MKSQFLLNPDITFLNHGSFGACPKPVFENYQFWQLELEKEPVQFLQKKQAIYLNQAKNALAAYINCEADDFFFTQNPTFAINVVMRNLNLQAGDEILTTNHEYGAMDRTWHYYCKKTGVKYVRQPISLPIVSQEQIVEEFWKGYTPKTKVVFINQMSSATALLFPVKEIIAKAKSLGLITIVDGAHVPGHIDLDINDLDPDFYTGTTHKWLLAPKGSSFLYVNKKFQKNLDPLIVSWGYESVMPSSNPFLDLHEIQGTRDIAAFLSLPTAIEFVTQANYLEQQTAAKQLVLDQYHSICQLLDTSPLCPVNNTFLGQMASVPIQTKQPMVLKEMLYNEYQIEIPIMNLNNQNYIRYSINVYNTIDDLEKLKSALLDIKNKNSELL